MTGELYYGSTMDIGLVKEALEQTAAAEYGSQAHTYYGGLAWKALGVGRQGQLEQLLKGPTWDGDVIGKSARDDLLSLGLAVRCCVNYEQGYTAASYLGYTIYKIGTEP